MSEQAPSTADFLARIALLEAAVCARDTTIAERDEQLRRERAEAALRIQRLQLQIDRFNRKTFGRSSEKLGQMRLELEDLETDVAASVPDIELPIVADTDKVRVLPVRKLNPNLPRKRIVREPPCACCPGCGGDLRAMGEDREEMLDLVAQAWQVIETVRPKYSCRTCDKIIQAPAPVKAIARGKLSYAALAHIIMAKWGYHLPFYRKC
ncbi:IS66 family transposase zinc-finger binding domain-containing protein [Mesorhizobium sp.]|uniref:IS66 family transposase zinc-finger binding domain-containing protein n=1 Tax=Mesorhizobium sp. TaxID=1871066 RepID=UPI0025F46516|nr:IS66 family transposase zinc-finger binding domain-containing protein [Mesorhizobium sp.]